MGLKRSTSYSNGWLRSYFRNGKETYVCIKQAAQERFWLAKKVVPIVNKLEAKAEKLYSGSGLEGIANDIVNGIDVRLLRGYTYCKCKSTQVAESVVSWNNLLLAVAGLETMSKKNSKLDAACRKNAKLSDVILKLEAEKENLKVELNVCNEAIKEAHNDKQVMELANKSLRNTVLRLQASLNNALEPPPEKTSALSKKFSAGQPKIVRYIAFLISLMTVQYLQRFKARKLVKVVKA
mmetsp:Transcript_2412/g.2745  ORF Transcript_2412/g.2745 Transcript_2412/m.2745 type:complete len:237 (+) Transcript_2412:218-928(+)|eukprot:CAMPEP_0184018272 /NCGR_PEP_ID=MMETSP0954-20121128/8052_1 /TAXON_ID=627963 /ORGANISM="Aplanochytrium sp, Strain PBS07" /LENGTH=236 /DNA_ID=CAMNT_0026299705 /DNA_START=139 /DNA_END=849 /DNA_ORIENTATION=+